MTDPLGKSDHVVLKWKYLLDSNTDEKGKNFCSKLKVECLLTLAIWSYGHEAEEYIFLNLPFPSNPKENSSIRCILSTPEQNLL